MTQKKLQETLEGLKKTTRERSINALSGGKLPKGETLDFFPYLGKTWLGSEQLVYSEETKNSLDPGHTCSAVHAYDFYNFLRGGGYGLKPNIKIKRTEHDNGVVNPFVEFLNDGYRGNSDSVSKYSPTFNTNLVTPIRESGEKDRVTTEISLAELNKSIVAMFPLGHYILVFIPKDASGYKTTFKKSLQINPNLAKFKRSYLNYNHINPNFKNLMITLMIISMFLSSAIFSLNSFIYFSLFALPLFGTFIYLHLKVILEDDYYNDRNMHKDYKELNF
jgi:hypothetical protein